MKKIVEISNGVTRHPLWRMASPVNLQICEGEQIAILGNNASGKSRLIEIITQHYPLLMNEVKYDFSPSPLKLVCDNLKYIAFRDSYGDSDANYYYQKRWNQHDIENDTPTVGELLSMTFEQADKNFTSCCPTDEIANFQIQRSKLREKLSNIFQLEQIKDKYIISLSSGEMRKFQLAKTIGTCPRLLILDNPFIGLDANTREQLRNLLYTLTTGIDLQIILVLSRQEEIPDFITHIYHVENLEVYEKLTRTEYECFSKNRTQSHLFNSISQQITELPQKDLIKENFYPQSGGEILKFNNVSIRYGKRTIINHLNWTVKEGERWALCGENGSGKSTLLSLICADNPQSYACDIQLFGHQRGSGESIWQIKRHIGYVSPEMHRAYLRDIPAIDIVASGLTDSIGLYCRPKPEDREACMFWMEIFGIAQLANTTFLKLSSGEQRLCLLARAFVKDPELLILDEPLHGLDNVHRTKTIEIIEAFCQRKNKTLIMVTHYNEELPNCITNRLILKKQ